MVPICVMRVAVDTLTANELEQPVALMRADSHRREMWSCLSENPWNLSPTTITDFSDFIFFMYIYRGWNGFLPPPAPRSIFVVRRGNVRVRSYWQRVSAACRPSWRSGAYSYCMSHRSTIQRPAT